MKKNYLFIIYFVTLIICYEAYSNNIFDSDFYNVEVKTTNANEAKENLINHVKELSLLQLLDKILDDNSNKKFNKIIGTNITSNQLIKNIIIENEIITEKKYIANIKINFNKEKIINLLINNRINYTNIKSEPFLVISSYNINFVNIGLEKINYLNNILKTKSNNKNQLINFNFPNLDPNDRYILPYKKLVNEDKKALNKILEKYNLNQLIYINVSQSNIKNKIKIFLKIYDINGFQNIGILNFNDSAIKKSNKSFDYIADEILLYLAAWWKNKYQIDNSKFNSIECKIFSTNFENLIKIKSIIRSLSQVKHVNTKKIHLNSNIVEFFYYGDFNVLIKNLSFFDLVYQNINGCIITNE